LELGKTRNQRLADHYLEVAGVSGVVINHSQEVFAVRRIVTVDHLPEGFRMVCCENFENALHLARAQYLYGNMQITERAHMMGIGITPHDEVVARALSAVEAVNAEVRKAQSDGSFRIKNSAFKAQRRHDPSLRYHDWLERQKRLLLEVMAKETASS
jgi:hypothetical protein